MDLLISLDLTYSHEVWIMTEKKQILDPSGLRVSELRDPMELLVELLLLIVRTQLRWFRDRIRVPPGPLEVF